MSKQSFFCLSTNILHLLYEYNNTGFKSQSQTQQNIRLCIPSIFSLSGKSYQARTFTKFPP